MLLDVFDYGQSEWGTMLDSIPTAGREVADRLAETA